MRSSTSIGANIHEARGAVTKRKYRQYYTIALQSANETMYWLILLEKGECANIEQQREELFCEVEQLAKIIAACIIKLEAKN